MRIVFKKQYLRKAVQEIISERAEKIEPEEKAEPNEDIEIGGDQEEVPEKKVQQSPTTKTHEKESPPSDNDDEFMQGVSEKEIELQKRLLDAITSGVPLTTRSTRSAGSQTKRKAPSNGGKKKKQKTEIQEGEEAEHVPPKKRNAKNAAFPKTGRFSRGIRTIKRRCSKEATFVH